MADETPETPALEWEEIRDTIVELPAQEGILLPAAATTDSSAAMEFFRRYAREVWMWEKPITNAGIDGPHRYMKFPAFTPEPEMFREDAIRLIRAEGTPITTGDFDEKVGTVAQELADASADPGGWRRSIFESEDADVAWYWKIRVGYVG